MAAERRARDPGAEATAGGKAVRAGEVARRRHARGPRLNHPEAVALIASEVLELIRDGKGGAEIMSIWSTLLALCSEHAELEMRCRTGFPELQHFHPTDE